jgi:23S rRNA G2069 N7-methylase RlmK/C1962 C5-methylase RlmI
VILSRPHRRWLGELCGGKTVLDTFCYSGGFSISAAKGGASQVTAVDSSEPALSLARRNMELNGVAESVSFEQADVLEFLVRASKEGKTFDIVILDPPKLAPSRKDLDRAKGKYKKLQKAGLACVAPGGLLVTCTCSSAMAQNDELLPVIRAAASGDDPKSALNPPSSFSIRSTT